MGLEELVARLEHDADARVADILARADAEVVALAAEAVEAASRHRDGTLAARRAARREELDREAAVARRGLREARLIAENALLERAFARTVELFEEVERTPEVRGALVRATENALRYFDGPAVVRARPSIAEALRAATLARERVASVTIEADPSVPVGVIVTGVSGLAEEAGAVVVDETLVARLDRLRPRLAIALLREAAP
jgi:vacuolar-type H+-ATPase subunit E/Vma4